LTFDIALSLGVDDKVSKVFFETASKNLVTEFGCQEWNWTIESWTPKDALSHGDIAVATRKEKVSWAIEGQEYS